MIPVAVTRHVLPVLGAIVLTVAPLYAQDARSVAPDLVLYNGRVFTADSTGPWAEALAIRADRIVSVGTSARSRALAGPRTRLADLRERVVIPGFNDAYVPLALLPLGALVRMGTDPSPRRVADSLAAAGRRYAAGEWIAMTVGSAVLDDTAFRRAMLDSIAPRHPVWLASGSGGRAILNSAALRLAGVADSAADPPGGWYERSADVLTGALGGYAVSNARLIAGGALPESVLVRSMRERGAEMVRHGITSAQVALGHLDPGQAMRVVRAAALPIRLRVIAVPSTIGGRRQTREWDVARRQAPPPTWSSMLGVSGIGWRLDGSPAERLAALRAPYADRLDAMGLVAFPADTVRTMLRELRAGGEQLHLHARGDSTISLVLGLMPAMAPDSVWRRARVRIEGGDGLVSDLWPLAQRLGVVVVQRPAELANADLLRRRLGVRAATYQPLRSLLARGIPVALASDGETSPYVALALATTHPANAAEALSREEAVRALTWGSAYAEFADQRKGTIAPGMLADLAVLSQDVFRASADRLTATTSVLTLVGGQVVYDTGVVRLTAPRR